MFGWIWWNCLARAGSAPFEKSCHVSYVRVTGLDGSGIEGLSLLRSSFWPIAFFCNDWLTDCVFPPEPPELDEPHPAATISDSTQIVHPATFLIPILLRRQCCSLEPRAQFRILTDTLVKNKSNHPRARRLIHRRCGGSQSCTAARCGSAACAGNRPSADRRRSLMARPRPRARPYP